MSDSKKTPIRTGFLIHDVSRLWYKAFHRQVKVIAGITRPQWWLLISLTRNDNSSMTQVELAHLLDVGKVPLGKMIDRLEKTGLIVRTPDQLDRRSKRVALSAKGLALIERMHGVALDLGRQIMREVPESQHRTLDTALATMKRSLLAMEAQTASAESRSRPAKQR